MRNQRTAHRWQVGAVILFGVLLAFGSFWLLQVINRGQLPGAASARNNEPDYFVHNFSVVRMDPAGKPVYIVSGAKLTHFPADDSSNVELPFVRKLSAGLPPTNIKADRARIDQGNSRVQLNDNVVLDRAAAPTVKRMNLKTSAMTIFPDADRMETDQPVELLMGTSVLHGTGMAANNATRQIDVTHKVRITYPPVPR